MDEKTARDKVQSTFSDLDTWEKIPGPFIAGSGSELRGDDYDWPPFGVSQVAWSGLQVAVDCLQAVRHHLDPEKTAKARHFLFADLSLCRTALVGASQAVWVLAPDSQSLRVERARTIVAYTQSRHVDYLHALQAYAQTPDENTDTVTAHVEKRITELNAKRAADGQKAALNTTKMIREAAQSTFGQLAEEAVLAWMEGSGAAHGLIWQVLVVRL